jgi:regulator of protease activity HflC (stomatin/prohibitin superfamily)
MSLADILVGRARMDADLQEIIDERTNPWGVTVNRLKFVMSSSRRTWRTQ